MKVVIPALITAGFIGILIVVFGFGAPDTAPATGNFEHERQDLVLDEKSTSVFFDFNDDVENSETAICGETCNGIEKNTSFVQGVTGSAVKFEAQNESWLTVPHHPSLSFGEEGGATIVFSVKVDTHSYKHNMIYNKGDVGWGYFYNPSYDGLYEGEFLEFQAIWTGDEPGKYVNVHCNDGKEIELNKWYFVAHVLESDHKTLKQYINGIEMCSSTSKKPLNTDSLNDLNLGHVEGTYNDFSQLALDNFTIFNYSLTADEISILYQKLS